MVVFCGLSLCLAHQGTSSESLVLAADAGLRPEGLGEKGSQYSFLLLLVMPFLLYSSSDIVAVMLRH